MNGHPSTAEITDSTVTAKASQPTALIVDDNWHNRLVSRMVLENAGYKVVEATHGGEALLLLAEQLFDLMVLDLLMPVMGGEEVLKFVRMYDVYQKMPIIVTTAYEEAITERITSLTPYVLQRPVSVYELTTLAYQFRTTAQH